MLVRLIFEIVILVMMEMIMMTIISSSFLFIMAITGIGIVMICPVRGIAVLAGIVCFLPLFVTVNVLKSSAATRLEFRVL